MSLLSRLREALLGRSAKEIPTATAATHSPLNNRIPPFHLPTAELMRFDPQVRIALGARNGLLSGAKIEVRGEQEEIVRWVEQQWSRLWCAHGQQWLRAKLYGYLPFEAVFRQVSTGEFRGFVEVARLKEHHPRATRLLAERGQIAGFKWGEKEAEQTLLSPRALVCTYGAEFENYYGCSLLERAYPAWYEKWMDGGVKQTLRLRMLKDAYVGEILWYPPDRKVELADGQTLSWREIAREMVENRVTGGALTLPLIYDHDGKRLIDYTPPRETGQGTAIFEWKRDNDREIWKALEVPPEILEAAATGSGYSGRWIPFAVACSAVQSEFAEIVRCVDRDLLRPLVRINFGVEPNYELATCSLLETYREAFAGN